MHRDPITETLRERFGFSGFREGQEAVIRQLLEGHSALAVFPTGSGKSLCYQLPALLLPGLTLIVSPLIALMKNQVDFLKAKGISAARLDSSVSLEELRKIDAEIAAGTLKLLYVAPERFSNERFIQKLRRSSLSLMAIDEAHCISEWGHNFRPDYLKLARVARSLEVPRILALTATATPDVAKDVCKEFDIAPEAYIHTGFHRPNLELRVTGTRASQRIQLLLTRLKSRPTGATIVYVTLQKTAEMVAEELTNAGFTSLCYHAGLTTEEREAAQEKFMTSTDAIVVATIAFGMGIDKSDIRYVYHFNLPKSLESYSQEIGRAGRDGAPAICEMLACGEDVVVLENFTYGDTPEPASVRRFVDFIFKQHELFDVSNYEISRSHDLRPLVVGTLFTYLELDDVIVSTSPFYSEYQFVPLRPSKEMLAQFDEERATFLRKLFARAVKAQKWFTLDVVASAAALEVPRDRIVRAFGYLEEKGFITLKASGLRHGYRKGAAKISAEELTKRLVARFELRERNDIERVKQVVALASHSGCLTKELLAHFGEMMETECGHCGICHGDDAAQIAASKQNVSIDFELLQELRRTSASALASPRQAARFFCGLTSPALTNAKLGRHPRFGALAEFSFHTVMQAVARG